MKHLGPETPAESGSKQSPETFLFVSFLIMGKHTAYQNLRNVVDTMNDIRVVWVPIEMDPPEWFARMAPLSRNHSLKYGMVARRRVRAAERRHGPFAAAYFNHILPALMLGGFRRRVPSVDSLDVTPADLQRHGQSYYTTPRSGDQSVVRNAKHRYGRRVYGQAAHLLPYSEFTRTSLIRDYGIERDSTSVLPPGVDLVRWSRKRPHDVSQRPFNVLFVGNDVRRKGGDLVMEVARHEEFAEVEFHLVTGQQVVPPSGNVKVHTGVQPNSEEMILMYEQADVFVLPTRGDFGPTNAISEALAMSLPVIATGIGGIDEVVQDGTNGFIIQGDDPEGLALRLIRLRDDIELRRSMAAASRRIAGEKLDARKNAMRVVEFMKSAARQAEMNVKHKT